MIRNLLATTAIATLLATGAYAQTTAPVTTDPAAAPAEETAPVERAEGNLASNIIGENVYTSTADDAENIGTVTDIVLGTDGSAEMVVIGVGGFLGLGQKDVAVGYDEVEWAQREDGSTWLVVATTREQLEQQAEFDRDAYDPEVAVAAGDGAMTGDTATAPAATDGMAAAPAADDAMEDDDMAAAPATDDAMEDDAADTSAMAPAADDAEDTTATAPAATDDSMAASEDDAMTDDTSVAAIDRSTLNAVDATGISAEDFIGTTVYGADDDNIGSIEDVILSEDGQVEAVTIDVGGFLGIGAKEVAVSMDNLEFMNDDDGEMYLYTAFTEEQLEAQPEYDEATYADDRDNQLLMNQ